jgi:Sec-independent protein secretion pathway component TatC
MAVPMLLFYEVGIQVLAMFEKKRERERKRQEEAEAQDLP